MKRYIKFLGGIVCFLESNGSLFAASSCPPAPELSMGSAVSGITLVVGGVLIYLDWRRRNKASPQRSDEQK